MNGCTWLVFSCIGLFLLAGVMNQCEGGGSSSSSNDGVLKSAEEKVDKGLPLNDKEAKRLDEALDASGKRESDEIERRNGEK